MLLFGLLLFVSGYILNWQYVSAMNCCQYLNNSNLLLNCTLAKVETNRNMNLAYGPLLKIGIVIYYTSDINMYASYASSIISEYAEYHGYELMLFNESNGNFDLKDHRWNKVKLLSSMLDPSSKMSNYWDYVVWMDADLIILDFNFRIESVVTDNAHIWASSEHEGSVTRINSGMLIVRNSNWAVKFLNGWWEFENRSLYSDQEQFDLLYNGLLSFNNANQYLLSEHKSNILLSLNVSNLRKFISILPV